MLTHEQVVAYLEETVPPEEEAGVEAEFTANAAAATQLTELAQYDSALRTLFVGAVERARIEESVLAAIREQSLHEHEAYGSRQTITQKPDHHSSNLGAPEDNNMNNPNKSSDNNLTKDQMAAQGIPTDLSGSDRRQSERYREDLAEEAKQKPAPAPESEKPGEENDYHNGPSH